MKSLWRLVRGVPARRYRSTIRCWSKTRPGVAFIIRRISLGRRIELAKSIRDLAGELEYQRAGESAKEQVEAAAISARIERAYLEWGLAGVKGLLIDGERVTAERLYECGPEDLAREIAARIKAECGLTDEERKN